MRPAKSRDAKQYLFDESNFNESDMEYMNLSDMPDETLLIQTEKLCAEERELLTTILHHLREIERRKLYATLKFPSLFEYSVKKLGYSEDQAYRRISAMRLLRELPELEKKINSGQLQLSHLGMANSFFNKEKNLGQKEFSKEDKLEILSKIENKSARDAEKIILGHSSFPILHRPERERVISDEMSEFNFVARSQLKDKINKLKGLLAHRAPHLSTADLIEKLCDLGLEKWGKGAFETASTNLNSNSSLNVGRNTENALHSHSWESLKKYIWRRDKGQCQNCGSSFALEVDHIVPKAKGGEDNVSNLRLLCRSCNQRAAIQHFGINKMDQHLN